MSDTPMTPQHDRDHADTLLYWLLFGEGTLTDIEALQVSRGRDKFGNIHVSITLPYQYEGLMRERLEGES